MEQSELFISLLLKIKEIEKQLSLSDDVNSKSVEEAEKRIEDHFEMYMKALAARKEAMLRELALKAAIQNEMFKSAKAKIKKAGDTCKHMAQTALMTFPVNVALAENICIEALSIPTSLQFSTEIDLNFPENLHANIGTYGKITGLDVSIVEAGGVSFEYPFRFSVASMATTIAGSPKWGKHDGKGEEATFNRPTGMCLNPLDDLLYVCDYAHSSIRTVSLDGNVGTCAKVSDLRCIALHHKEKAFFVTTSGQILRISFDGKSSVLAGNKFTGYLDGVGESVKFNKLRAIAIDQQTGHIFVCDYHNNKIRKVLPQGEVSTLAGSEKKGFVDGKGNNAVFNGPHGMCFDTHSNSLLVCDYRNNKIRRVQLNGEVSTLCEVPEPRTIAITSNKTMVISSNNRKIYKVIQKGKNYEVSILAGSGKNESVDGKPSECSFHDPRGIVIHEPSHSCFVADRGGHKIRKTRA